MDVDQNRPSTIHAADGVGEHFRSASAGNRAHTVESRACDPCESGSGFAIRWRSSDSRRAAPVLRNALLMHFVVENERLLATITQHRHLRIGRRPQAFDPSYNRHHQ
jgi:hypothetical protein